MHVCQDYNYVNGKLHFMSQIILRLQNLEYLILQVGLCGIELINYATIIISIPQSF